MCFISGLDETMEYDFVIMPNLYSLEFFLEDFSTFKSIILDKTIPIKKPNKTKNTAYINLYSFIIKSSELGIKSINEIVNITPLANPKALLIVSSLSFFTNIKRNPINVEIPAILDNKKAYILLDIISPVNCMLLLYIFFH